MKAYLTLIFATLLLAMAFVGAAHAESEIQASPVARYMMSIEDPMTMKSKDFDWDHQILVALPATYEALPEKSYPVLWLTDGPTSFNLTIGLMGLLTMGNLAPEMIIVAVGTPSELGMLEFLRRRSTDFAPPGDDIFYDGAAGEFLEKSTRVGGYASPPQKADKFLGFLIEDVRPALAKKYRTSGDHGLYGHSGGGMFAGYALFARPGGFSKYIIGSPSLYASDRKAFQLEEDYAKNHKDLDVSVFFGAGELEIEDTYMASWGLVSAAVLMAETLRIRQYPSLQVTTRIFPGKNHFTVVPDILSVGIQTLWADDVSRGDAAMNATEASE